MKNKKTKVLTKDEVFKILKKFTTECVHGGDFDQGQSEKDTLSILKNSDIPWRSRWKKEEKKYE